MIFLDFIHYNRVGHQFSIISIGVLACELVSVLSRFSFQLKRKCSIGKTLEIESVGIVKQFCLNLKYKQNKLYSRIQQHLKQALIVCYCVCMCVGGMCARMLTCSHIGMYTYIAPGLLNKIGFLSGINLMTFKAIIN